MAVYQTPPAMLTDLYEFTMAEVYFQRHMIQPATFSLFIRAYPPNRGYFVSAGLENVLAFLESAHFSSEDLDYLAETGKFSRGFIDYLRDFRFAGDVVAMPEGRLFFADEPVLEVTAPDAPSTPMAWGPKWASPLTALTPTSPTSWSSMVIGPCSSSVPAKKPWWPANRFSASMTTAAWRATRSPCGKRTGRANPC